MAKNFRIKHTRKKYALPVVGASPGQVFIADNALKPQINLHTYHAQKYELTKLTGLKNIAKIIADKNSCYWIEVKGFNAVSLFEDFSDELNIHKLILEDITRTYQRPKMEEYDNYIFAISRMLYLAEDKHLENEQVSFILTENALFTFQEKYDDCFATVRTRLKVGKGNIRTAGSSYLMYAVMDAIIDSYFAVLSHWGEELDDIEDRLLQKPEKTIMFDIQQIKRNLINIRRIAWPERDKLNDILRSDSPLIAEQTKMYIRDAYDHCVQIIDIIESMKEISASSIDMYLSVISNRMNEIMKVLTIITSVFIPLTFIAGIYGMNFSREDPVTGKVLNQNMPELYQEHGYLYTMLVMAAIAILQIVYFWRKGWFK